MKLTELELDPELLSLVVFGPGFGEAILVFIPGGHWFAVDSLRRQTPDGDTNPAVELLLSHDAHLSAIALTHPHADHVQGLLQLLDLRLFDSPVGCLPAYLPRDESWRTHHDAAKVRDGSTTMAALNRIDDIWRTEAGSKWPLLAESSRKVGDALVEVLHPATLPSRKPSDLNRLSHPMLLSWEGCRLLLGADLPVVGWRSVANSHASASELAGAQALKVSHHASGDAQHPIAIGEPPPTERCCVATPFNRGKRPLPDYSEGGGIDQLLKTHSQVWVTAVPAAARGKTTPRARLDIKGGSFGEFELIPELHPTSPAQGWTAVSFDTAGVEITRCQGDAAGLVI